MRRSIVAIVVATGLTLSVLAAGSPTATADDPQPATDSQAQAALATAQAVLGDAGGSPAERRTSASRPDATLALRDLFVARDRLSGDDRQQADGLLARPTAGAGDRYGDGYTVPAEKKCKAHFCIHWVTSTADAPPSQAWVDANLTYMNKVWRTEIKKLGYRKPITDGNRGGNSKFDVYLKELGSKGLYGYCAPEKRTAKYKWLAFGYCVLDNDFAESQYGAPPKDSLRVTGAHEFFHAIQFAYDYGEDGWLLESTATWMEERVADDVNDNRQYLPAGQVGVPGQPLDVYNQQGFNQYGNWTFWEYLGSRFGSGLVRALWTEAGAFPGGGHQYSTTALKHVLAKHGGFVSIYRAYAAANTVPGRSYSEGKDWPVAPPGASWKLSKADPRSSQALKVNHMAARTVLVRPDSSLGSKRWNLRITIDGPAAKTDPAAYLVIKRVHGVSMKAIPLNGKGKGRTSIPFSVHKVRSATIVLVNASTRFACWHQAAYSCQGRPRDNNEPFTVRTAVSLPKRHH
jgi:hypothetical protein